MEPVYTAPRENTYVPAAPAPAAASPQPAAAGESCTPTRYKHDTVAYKLRYHRVPPAVMASLAAGAAAGNHLGDLAGTHLIPGLITEGIYLILAVLFWIRADKAAKRDVAEMEQRWNRSPSRRQRRRAQQNRRYQLVVSATGAAWLAWTYTELGTAAWSGVSLVALGAAFWAVQALRYGLPAPRVRVAEPVTTEVVDDVAGRLRDAFNTYLLPNGRPAHGAVIERWQNIEAGGRLLLEIDRGRQSIETIRGLLPGMKGALRCHDVTVDYAEEEYPGDPGYMWVTAITRPEVGRREQTYDRPGLRADGVVGVGGYVDGQGEGPWTLYTTNRMHGGFILGDPAKGKSQLSKNIAASAAAGPEDPDLQARYAGCVVVHLDPDGSSEPELSDWAHLTAFGVEECRVLLEDLHSGMMWRRRQNSVNRWQGFDPYTQDRPGVLIVTDELHILSAHKDIRGLMEQFPRNGTKVGFAFLALDQDCTLNAFGDQDVFRSTTCATNIAVFRTSSSNPGSILPGLPANPMKITNQPGFCVITGRSAELRTYYVTRPLAEIATSAAFDAGTASAMPRYKEWLETEQEARANAAAIMRAEETGEEPPPKYIRPCLRPPEKPAEPAPSVPATTTAAEPGRAAVLHLVPSLVASMPSFDDDDDATTAPPVPVFVPPAPAPPRIPARDTVLLLLAQGVTSSGALQTRGAMSETTVRNVCGELVAQGLLAPKSSKFDPWVLTPAGYMEAGRLTAVHPTATANPLRSTS